ncbi:alpha/beta fold hydrolase [Cellulomonas chengniuliangii]|uniref:Alpha/beta hydrolase n=1 Tax=Cellulomonas chengniuliangii TaxID=2968084 RepID=A0ABY5KVN2_9CELL|nr:alpha/beta hydrolase [Cellulomonas chengniuliangii]MCC2310021.1 alpha/beta hydrolase [Cellulomonas chengniuliangii]UUI74582.1 alpha/beta hydrolase [Cellulomonas chengniuliangii]
MPAPTVLLVHGAFADGSSWSRVIDRLQAEGVSAQALANPLRGLTHDGEYVANAAAQVEGPVVLVGHSYGGPVVTYAGGSAPNVTALVLVASFGVDYGVSALGSVAEFPESELNTALEPRAYPGSESPELYIRRDRFHSVFAADLPEEETALLAATQRPVALAGLNDVLEVEPAWKTIPVWFAVATQDHTIDPNSQRAAAARLGATTVEVEGSHAIALSQPDAVAALVLAAVRAQG